MQKHAPPHPGVHLEKSGGFYFFDVDRFALVQHRQVHGHSNLLAEHPHERQRDVGDVQIGLRVSAETEDLETEAVASRFRLAAQIAASFEGAQNVAGGTLGDGQFAADLRIGHSVAAVGRGFENVQGALDGNCGTGV